METDAILLTEFTRTRSEQAFRRLVERYGGIVHSICCRKLRDPHLAEDAAQMVFATLARKASSVDPALVGPWLFQTANFVARGLVRERVRRTKHEHRTAADHPRSYEAFGSTVMVELVEQHLMQLDETSRNALVLRYLHEQSVPEIAAALKITPEATKKRLLRGLDRLRTLMTEGGVVASIAMAESALQGMRGGTLPTGFVDRTITKLGSQGLFGDSRPAPPRVRSKTLPLIVGTTATLGVLGMLTIWRAKTRNGIPRAVAMTSPPIIPSSPTIQERLQQRVPHLSTPQSDLDAILGLLSARTGEKFEVQWEHVKAVGIERGAEVEEDFQDLTLGQALDQLLGDFSSQSGKLRYVVEPNRIVITASPAGTSASTLGIKN